MGWSRAIGAGSLALVLLGGASALVERRSTAPAPAATAPAATAAPAPAPPAPAASPACEPGVDATHSVPDRSAPGGRRTVWVHRPAGPDRADLPVLYLLHGFPADPAALVRGSLPGLLDAQMCRTGRPFVIAVPDGRAGRLDTEWGDDARGRFAVETFVTQGAVALVEGDRRRPAPLRAIAGFSMGGYGAAALALRHPDEYRQVASFSGYYRIDDPDGVFGKQPGAHAPDRLLGAASGQRYFLVEGTGEHTPLRAGSIRGEADRFATALRARQVTVSVAHPPGGHADDCWYPQLGAMVDFLDAGWPAA
jgi:S-formylglutathione hydrolase FrmB